jgi:hypothetical protein
VSNIQSQYEIKVKGGQALNKVGALIGNFSRENKAKNTNSKYRI